MARKKPSTVIKDWHITSNTSADHSADLKVSSSANLLTAVASA